MTSLHPLVSEKKRMIHWELITGQLIFGPDTGYPRLGLFGPLLLFLQPSGHLLISPFVKGKVKGRTKR